MDNLGIYFINLDHRQDKNRAAVNQLTKTEFPFQRIDAVKFTEVFDSEIPYKYFRLVSAVKKSHIKACKSFLESKYEMALILEDDFMLDLPKFRGEIERVCQIMRRKGINFLQLGHLTFVESGSPSSNVRSKSRRLFESLYQIYMSLRYPFSPVLNRRIRWGAQAYLVDKTGATSLIGLLNVDNPAPIDRELMTLSKIGTDHENYFSMASLKKNLIRQNLEFKSDTQGVV